MSNNMSMSNNVSNMSNNNMSNNSVSMHLRCSSIPEGVMQPLVVRLIWRLNLVKGLPGPRECVLSCKANTNRG